MAVPLSHTYRVQKSAPRTTTSLGVDITRIVAAFPRKVYLQWVIRNPQEGVTYLVQVYRSGSSEGPWEHVGVDLADAFNYVDVNFESAHDRTTASLFSMHRSVYYKVVLQPSTGTAVETVKKLEGGLDRRRKGIHRKLQRDAAIYLKKVMGTEVAIFKRRRWGAKCTCLSSTGQSTRSHCSTCFGTGIVDGYWNPVYGYGQRMVAPVQVQTGPQGQIESHRLQAIILNIPQVEPDDILVFLRDNKRYIVESSTPTQIHFVDVHQELVLSEISASSREYGLKADQWSDPPWF